jgi:hypothetical protein
MEVHVDPTVQENKWWHPWWWRFSVQVALSLIAIAFGISVFFGGYQTIGVGLVTTVLGLWMQSPAEPFINQLQSKTAEEQPSQEPSSGNS